MMLSPGLGFRKLSGRALSRIRPMGELELTELLKAGRHEDLVERFSDLVTIINARELTTDQEQELLTFTVTAMAMTYGNSASGDKI